MSNRISGILMISLIALCVVIVMEARSGVPSAGNLSSSPEKGKADPAAGPVRLTLPPLASLSETVERPLFSESRRPPEEESNTALEVPTPVPSGTSTNFNVSAIVITDDERAVLLVHPESGDLTRVAEGEMISGWRLEKVEADRAIFSRDGETQEAALRAFGPPPPIRARRSGPAASASGGDARERTLRRALSGARLPASGSQEQPASQR